MNPQATVSPQPQAGVPIQPQATTTSPQGVVAQAPVQAPAPPVLPQGQTPVASPLAVQQPNFNTSQTLQAIGQYYGIPRQTTQLVNQGQTQSNIASANFEAQKAQNSIKIQNQQNSLDPTKYQFVKNKDGSVTILNSVGDVAPIGTYASLTGANPAQALQQNGATDQASEQFIAAYNNLQTYIQDQIAAKNGDAQAQAEIQDFQKANPGLANMELGQLQTAFMNQYGSYFGQSQQGAGGGNLAPGVTNTLTSENNPASTSAYENQIYNTLLPNQTSTYTPSPVAGGATQGGNSLASELAQLQSQTSQ